MSRAQQVTFQNTVNPTSSFDFLLLEDLLSKETPDHDIDKPQKLNFYVLVFVTEGMSYHAIDFTDYTIQKGTILTIRKDQVHHFFKSSNIKGYLLLFTNDFLISYLEQIEANKTLQLFNELLGSPKLQLQEPEYSSILQLVQRIQQEYFYQFDEFSLSIIRSKMHILITKLFRLKAKEQNLSFYKKYLQEYIQFQTLVEQNYANSRQVYFYANKLNVSTKTLNKITNSILNRSAKDCIDEITIRQIKRLIIHTNLSIKEIAFQTGFEETTNFYKYFKRQVNNTPEQFRATHQ